MKYTAEDIAPEALAKMHADCDTFVAQNAKLLEALAKSHPKHFAPGHDLWLTRNGHGAGFWDRDYGKLGDILTDAAHAMGECYLYVGDDGKIYLA